ncbi:MAG: lipocalin family protein [Phycisphaerae bacterium]|nr:lipocalin family protein [Saprospiraceae bacterium]
MNYKRITQALFLAAMFTLAFCQKANDKNPALLGSWQGTEWLIMDRPSGMDATQVHFEFKEDGTFSALFGDQIKAGTWRTEKDKLYTKETGKQEIIVKLLKYDGAALDFEMNRGGQKEVLKLAKK